MLGLASITKYLRPPAAARLIDTSLSARSVAKLLDRILERKGHLWIAVGENGTELAGNAITPWEYHQRSKECQTLNRANL